MYLSTEMHNEYTIERVDAYLEDTVQNGADKKFVSDLVKVYIDHHENVDNEITSHLKKGWKLERLAKIDLAIYELH